MVAIVLLVAPASRCQSWPVGFGAGAVGGCYSLDEVITLLDFYAATYPAIVSSKQTIGLSAEGRPIYAVCVSDHPSLIENEPTILIDALHHAREPLSMQLALALLHRLATGYGADAEITQLVNERQVWIVPVVNPDGYLFNATTQPNGGGLWRKNRRLNSDGSIGVDLNRNYAVQWGADDVGSSGVPAAESYRGAAPLSEPETMAMHLFALNHSLDSVVSLHSHGRLMAYPVGHSATTSIYAAQYAEQAQELVKFNGYPSGEIHSLLGLANGNAVDHHEAMSGARAWTFELGGSFWPTTVEMMETVARNLEPLLSLIRYCGAWLDVVDLDVREWIGDGDGFVEAGEQAEIVVVLRNRGIDATSTSVVSNVTSADAAVAVAASGASMAPLGPFTSTSVPNGSLRVDVSPAAASGKRVEVDVTIEFDSIVLHRTVVFNLGVPRILIIDPCETELGWQTGVATDNAMSGRWTRDDPHQVLHNGEVAQPENDATPGSGKRCYVTGNMGTVPGQDDVDDGSTTLVSPRFDLSHALSPHLRYQRFYWCSNGDDPLSIELSNDDGANYVSVEEVLGRPNQWTQLDWRIDDLLAPTDAMRLRVVARDPTNNSVTEALFDEFAIVDYGVDPHLAPFGSVRSGKTFELQLAAPAAAGVTLFAAMTPAAIPVGPIGVLGLDPNGIVVMASTVVPASGLLRIVVPVPTSPLLIGTTPYLQGLVLHPSLRLTQAIALPIAPP